MEINRSIQQEEFAQVPLSPSKRKPVNVYSPLRFPGSKRRLGPYVAELLDLNSLHPQLLVEPFAGGASIAIQLLSDGKVSQVGLADIDPMIAALWKTIFSKDAEWLAEQVMNIDVTLDMWKQMKRSTPTNRRDQAMKCLFLNRTNFSGIMTAGPIGGMKQQSAYKIDCRFPRETLVKRIKALQQLSDSVKFVWNCSWNKTMSRVAEQTSRQRLPSNIFWYFDPPFFEKASGLYSYWFTYRQHRHFRDKVVKLKDPWVLSYDSVPKVVELYGDYSVLNKRISTFYSTYGPSYEPEAILSNVSALPEREQIWTERIQSRANSDRSKKGGGE